METGFLILERVAEKLSYKPNHSFSVRKIDDETAIVSLRCPELPNSQPENIIVGLTINNTIKLSKIVTASDALQAYANVVADFELHEAAEFFKFNGHQVFLPHGWENEFGGFSWKDFVNLNGKFLRALRNFLGKGLSAP